MDCQKITLLSLLDMSAAFDTVDHEILLRRLEVSYGVRGQVLDWFTSFLTDRTQAVTLANCVSSRVRLICGLWCATRLSFRATAVRFVLE